MNNFVPEHAAVIAIRLRDRTAHHSPIVLSIEAVFHGHQVLSRLDLHIVHWVAEHRGFLNIFFLTTIKADVVFVIVGFVERRAPLIYAFKKYWGWLLPLRWFKKLMFLWYDVCHHSLEWFVSLLIIHRLLSFLLGIELYWSEGDNFTAIETLLLGLLQLLLGNLQLLCLLERSFVPPLHSIHLFEHWVDLS